MRRVTILFVFETIRRSTNQSHPLSSSFIVLQHLPSQLVHLQNPRPVQIQEALLRLGADLPQDGKAQQDLGVALHLVRIGGLDVVK